MYNEENIRNLTWYITAGNHDHGQTKDWREKNEIGIYPGHPTWFYPRIAYTFTAKAKNVVARFTTIDTEINERRKYGQTAQKNILLKALYQTYKKSKRDWKIAWTHVPPFSSSDMYNVDDLLYKFLVWHFNQVGLDLHFAGHDHTLQHLTHNNVNYFISGAGAKKTNKYSKKSEQTLKSYGVNLQSFFSKPGFIHVILSEKLANVSFIGRKGKLLYNTLIEK